MKMKMMSALVVLALAGAAPAHAQLTPAASPDCDWDMSGNFPGFSPTPYACGGAFSGNSDQPAEQALITTWLNAPEQAGEAGGNTFELNETALGEITFGTSGVINFLSPTAGTFVLALKGSNTYSLYYFNVDAGSPIDFVNYVTNGVATNPQGRPQDLSNVSMWVGTGGTDPYCVDGDCEPNVVPEPTSFALMFAGVFALGAAARRRRNS